MNGSNHNMLLCNDNLRELTLLRHELRKLYSGYIYSAMDGVEAINILFEIDPDIVLLDLVMPGMDGLSIIRRIRGLKLPRLPRIAVLSERGQLELGQTAVSMGACMVIEKSSLPDALPDAMRRLESSSRRKLMGGAEIENRLYDTLIELGIARHLDGFKYIMEAVLLVLEDINYQNNFSKCLYPVVARRYNTTASCVERSIRHAVESACSHIRLAVLQREFGNTIDSDRGKPTNSEFIARVADKMRNGGAYIPRGD